MIARHKIKVDSSKMWEKLENIVYKTTKHLIKIFSQIIDQGKWVPVLDFQFCWRGLSMKKTALSKNTLSKYENKNCLDKILYIKKRT